MCSGGSRQRIGLDSDRNQLRAFPLSEVYVCAPESTKVQRAKAGSNMGGLDANRQVDWDHMLAASRQ